MKKNKNKNTQLEEIEKTTNKPMALDDDQRIKILSPGLLVFKRFIRNRLAITGAIFILIMFLFSFVGGWIMPYDESEIFTKYVDMSKVFAGVAVNTEVKFITVDGSEFPMIARSKFVLATNQDQSYFTSQDVNYNLELLDENLYVVNGTKEVAVATIIAGDTNISLADTTLDSLFRDAFSNAITNNEQQFTYNDKNYVLVMDKKNIVANELIPIALATMNKYDYNSANIEPNYEFSYQSELAIIELKESGSISKFFDIDET